MNTHGTPLSTGILANFLGAITKASTLLADRIDPSVVEVWGKNHDALLLQELINALNLPPAVFRTWRVVNVEIRKYTDDFIREFGRHKIDCLECRPGDNTRPRFIPQGINSGRVWSFKLACVSMSELGFTDNRQYTLGEGIDRARELQLGLLTADMAYELRLDYLDQPKGELLVPVCNNDRDQAYSGDMYFLLSTARGRLIFLREYFSRQRYMSASDKLIFTRFR